MSFSVLTLRIANAKTIGFGSALGSKFKGETFPYEDEAKQNKVKRKVWRHKYCC